MGLITRSHSFVSGEKPTEDEWNTDIDQAYTLLNGQIDKANVDSSSSDGIMTMDESQTITGDKTFTGDLLVTAIESRGNWAASTFHTITRFRHDPAGGSANDTGGLDLLFQGDNDAGTPETIDYAAFRVAITDFSDGTEDGEIHLRVMTAGTLATELELRGADLSPAADDGLALGISGTAYADLFLASGAVINFNAGDVTMTHSANTLAIAGGGVTMGSTLAVTGATTFTGAVIVDDTTESTSTITGSIQTDGGLGVAGDIYAGDDVFFTSGAVLNFNAGDVTITHSANTLTVAGGTWATAALTASTITGSGVLSIDDTTDSTSATTGSIHTDGGLGVAKDLIVGAKAAIGTVGGTAGTTLHVSEGDSGIALANAEAIVILEADANNCYVEFMTDTNKAGGFVWNDGAQDAFFQYDHSSRSMQFAVQNSVQMILSGAAGSCILDLVTTGNRIDLDTDNDTSIRASADDVIMFEVGASDIASLRAGGLFFINETANGDMTAGITIQQSSNDDQAFAIKSSMDISHAMTDEAEADTYLEILKTNAVTGGTSIRSYSEGNAAFDLVSRQNDGGHVTTDTSTSKAGVNLIAQRSSGAGVQDMSATGNVLAVTDGTNTRVLVKGDGAIHATRVTAGSGDLDGTALDNEHDRGLIRRFERTVHNDVGIIMSKWDEQLDIHDEDLRRVGVFKGDFYCMQRMDSLLGGGIWQNYCDIQELQEREVEKDRRIEQLEHKVLLLTEGRA